MKTKISIVLLMIFAGGLTSCNNQKAPSEKHSYTKLDSLTDTYLVLQDSILLTWNVMAKDENEKLRSLHELLHGMMDTELFEKSQLINFDQQLEQLKRIRFTQKTMANPHVVEEYDFASNALISEIVSQAESNPIFAQNHELQSFVDYVKTAEQRVEPYRANYDSVALEFNLFLEKYKAYLKEIDERASTEKKPLFQVASDN